jgi:DNA-binding YbaB/EbfC family protein
MKITFFTLSKKQRKVDKFPAANSWEGIVGNLGNNRTRKNMGTGFAKKKKQAKHLQAQMAMMQQSLASKMETMEVVGKAGNGLVTITLCGTGEMKKISIDPECVDPDDIEGLEALIKAAHREAFKEVQKIAESSPTPDSLSGFGFPGM